MSDTPAHDQHAAGVGPAEPAQDPQGSSKPLPVPPPPTVWPFLTAVGLAIFFWGMVLNVTVLAVGAAVFAIGMGGLTGDWVREHRAETN